jgi:hypothetical protein
MSWHHPKGNSYLAQVDIQTESPKNVLLYNIYMIYGVILGGHFIYHPNQNFYSSWDRGRCLRQLGDE